CSDEERAAAMARSPVAGLYDEVVDRESAYEMLQKAAAEAAAEAERAAAPEPDDGSWDDFKRRQDAGRGDYGYRGEDEPPSWRDDDGYRKARRYRPAAEPKRRSTRRSSRSDGIGEALVKQVVRTAGSQITRRLVRGVLGGLFRGR
ncbi:MAG: helicase HerA-like domain-containing protein, partial [Pseudomonadota bacterium]